MKQEIFNQRTQLAGIKTNDLAAQKIKKESFVIGYKMVLMVAVLLSLGSALSAAIFISNNNFKDPMMNDTK